MKHLNSVSIKPAAAHEDLSETYRALAYPDALLADCRTRSCTSGWWHSADAVRSHCRLDVMVCSSVGAANATASAEEEYAWYGHTEEYRSMIEQRARDYFKIAPEQPVHVNAWAASQRAYSRERWAEAEAERKQTEALDFYLVPKKSPKGSSPAQTSSAARPDPLGPNTQTALQLRVSRTHPRIP